MVEIQSPPDSASLWIPIHARSASTVMGADISSDELAAFTLYGVRVVAMYSDGDPVPSEEHVVLTGTDVPANSPNNVVVTALIDTSALNISWDVSCGLELTRGRSRNFKGGGGGGLSKRANHLLVEIALNKIILTRGVGVLAPWICPCLENFAKSKKCIFYEQHIQWISDCMFTLEVYALL